MLRSIWNAKNINVKYINGSLSIIFMNDKTVACKLAKIKDAAGRVETYETFISLAPWLTKYTLTPPRASFENI